jgi:hypothetical protein
MPGKRKSTETSPWTEIEVELLSLIISRRLNKADTVHFWTQRANAGEVNFRTWASLYNKMRTVKAFNLITPPSMQCSPVNGSVNALQNFYENKENSNRNNTNVLFGGKETNFLYSHKFLGNAQVPMTRNSAMKVLSNFIESNDSIKAQKRKEEIDYEDEDDQDSKLFEQFEINPQYDYYDTPMSVSTPMVTRSMTEHGKSASPDSPQIIAVRNVTPATPLVTTIAATSVIPLSSVPILPVPPMPYHQPIIFENADGKEKINNTVIFRNRFIVAIFGH